MNVRFHYRYRDGSNNKNAGTVIFANPTALSVERLTIALEELLDENRYFIADQIGIPSVFLWNREAHYNPDDESTYQKNLGPGNYCITEADHSWHEFDYWDETHAKPTDTRTVEEFLAAVQTAHQEGWKEFRVAPDTD